MISNKINLLFLLLLTSVFAQQKITVEAIYTGQFQAKGMDKLQSMKNTNQYTVLNLDQASRSFKIDLFDFGIEKTFEFVREKTRGNITVTAFFTHRGLRWWWQALVPFID